MQGQLLTLVQAQLSVEYGAVYRDFDCWLYGVHYTTIRPSDTIAVQCDCYSLEQSLSGRQLRIRGYEIDRTVSYHTPLVSDYRISVRYKKVVEADYFYWVDSFNELL
jgi:hypothetical protein